MKKVLLICTIFLLGKITVKAQTTLSPGDLAFIALNTDALLDQFSFVLLKGVETGTEIKFSDQGWVDGVGFHNAVGDNGYFIWTSTSNLTIGTIVTITTNNGNNTPTATIGSCSGNPMLISSIGDQILAFQGPFNINANFIAGIHFNVSGTSSSNWDGNSTSNSTSALPDALTNGDNAIWIYNTTDGSEMDNMIYNCMVAGGNVSEIRAAINNVANWSYNINTPYTQVPFPCSFSPTLSIEDSGLLKSVSIFPNPTDSHINIVLEEKTSLKLNIFNMAGQLVYKKRIDTKRCSFYFNGPSGVYTLELNIKGQRQYHKLIKE